jgi:hypothetical protein
MPKVDYDAGDEKQVKKNKTRKKIQAEQEQIDLKTILATAGGRRVIWWILEECGVYRTSFTGNSHTFFNEGKRQIGLMLIEKIFAADPTAYTNMRLEAAERKEGND